MENMDDDGLLAFIARRIKSDIDLINGLISSERRGSFSSNRDPVDMGRLKTRICAVSLGMEALFQDQSPYRIDLVRHLGFVVAEAAENAGVTSTWVAPPVPLLCPDRRAVLTGLALGDLCYLSGPVRVRLAEGDSGFAVCEVSADSFRESTWIRDCVALCAFARGIVEDDVGGFFEKDAYCVRMGIPLGVPQSNPNDIRHGLGNPEMLL